MLRTTLASSRVLRVCVFGLVTITTAVVFTTSAAEARRCPASSHARRHQEARESYSPPFSSIIVDGNSGATLSASNPDGGRHPASLTKIMTLYLLFERLDAGKMKLDTEMQVSEHASEQAPTKLGLRPGQSIRVEDAIKGLVTRSANDAAVVIAEAIGGDEDDFAKLMTRKARALGMTRTVYVNASGLPDDEQVTTARDQSTLGRAIQDRFPRYYRYFSTEAFNYHGQSIRNHNHLLGSVEGVDGIKTGYTRASGFNLVTSMRRGNRHLVGVVMGGRSGGSRDAIMRNLLAENLDKAATKRTVAAITERNPADANADVAEAEAAVAADADGSGPGRRSGRLVRPSLPQHRRCVPPHRFTIDHRRRDAAAVPRTGQARARAVDQRRDPDPVDRRDPRLVRTDEAGQGEDRPGQGRTGQAGLGRPVPAGDAGHQCDTVGSPGSAGNLGRRRRQGRNQQACCHAAEMPPQPANHGTGNGVLGVLPASSMPASSGLAGDGLRRSRPRSRRPSSRTAPSSRSRPTPDGSSRSARWRARAKRASASRRRATRPMACSARPIRSPNRSSPRATRSCSAPASPASTAIRPKRCAGR